MSRFAKVHESIAHISGSLKALNSSVNSAYKWPLLNCDRATIAEVTALASNLFDDLQAARADEQLDRLERMNADRKAESISRLLPLGLPRAADKQMNDREAALERIWIEINTLYEQAAKNAGACGHVERSALARVLAIVERERGQ